MHAHPQHQHAVAATHRHATATSSTITHRGVLAVDDGRQGEHGAVGVVDHWVHHAVLDDGDELLELLVVVKVVLQRESVCVRVCACVCACVWKGCAFVGGCICACCEYITVFP